MRDTARQSRDQILKDMVAELESLPDDQLNEARDFVEFLRHRAPKLKRGSPEALLRFFGTWDGPPGELDGLVAEIYEARHKEE